MAEEKSFFPLILCLILFMHGLMLFLKWQEFDPQKTAKKNVPAPIVVDFKNMPKRQIVDSEDSANREERPDAYLSDKTRSFDRQTKARVNDTFRDTQRAQGTPGPKGTAGKTKKSVKDLKFSDIGGSVNEDPFKQAAKEYTDMKNGKGNPNAGDGGKAPTRSISSTNDHLEGIPLGDITNLNTVEYKYYGFYHRIKQKLEQFWGRSLYAKAQQLAKQGRAIANDEHLITALQIVLDGAGKIVAINIMGSSGVKELDDAAIESFNQAGPFPNPPKDLIIDNRVTLEWGFVVDS